MNITQAKTAFLNGDTVYYAPQAVYDYLGWKLKDMPGAPFTASTIIPNGVINQLMNTPVISNGEIVDVWTASINAMTLPISRLYVSKDAFKTALKNALLAKVDEASDIAALDLSYANSVDEIGVPILSVNVETLDFGASETSLTFDITNTGEGELDWTITTSIPAKITVNPASGATQDETDTVTVTVNRTGIAPGTYYPTVNVVSDGGSAEITLTVVVG